MFLLKSIAVWLLILALAVANGALREGVLLKLMPRSPAFTLSGVILIACVLLAALLSIPWLGKLGFAQYLLTGALWFALTLAFEFGFGLARGRSLESLLQAYRFNDGDIWPIVLLVVAVAPVAAACIRGLLPAQD
jgi:hypothetical protein